MTGTRCFFKKTANVSTEIESKLSEANSVQSLDQIVSESISNHSIESNTDKIKDIKRKLLALKDGQKQLLLFVTSFSKEFDKILSKQNSLEGMLNTICNEKSISGNNTVKSLASVVESTSSNTEQEQSDITNQSDRSSAYVSTHF